MAWTFETTRRGYGNMWRSMAIKPGRDTELAVEAVNKILSLEDLYRDAFAGAGMPWYYGAAIHYRESNNDLRGAMVNGEKIIGTSQKTTLVPENRGPYATFKDSVQDAATLKGWRSIGPWSIERLLFTSEIWNGLGYVAKGINAPFVWAGTNHEEMGLYVRDHVFDASTEDTRLGVAAVVKRLMEVRPDIAAEIVMETTKDGQVSPQPRPEDRPKEGDVLDPLPGTPPIAAGSPLLLMLLLLLTKEKPPVNDEPTQSQGSPDLAKVLLPLILQSVISGKPLDVNALLPALLQGMTGVQLALPAPASVTPSPAPPAAPAAPQSTNDMLLPLLLQLLTGKPAAPAPTPAPVPPVVVAAPPSDPTVKPIVGTSALALMAGSVLQTLGVVGTPFGIGEAPTATGTLTTLIPIIAGVAGAFGGFGPLLNIGLKLFGKIK